MSVVLQEVGSAVENLKHFLLRFLMTRHRGEFGQELIDVMRRIDIKGLHYQISPD